MAKSKCIDCGKPLGGTDRRCYTCQQALEDELELDDPDPCPRCGSDDTEGYWLAEGRVFRVECNECGHRTTATVDIDMEIGLG